MQFYLHTKHTSYVMELYANHLAHSYWGSRVNEIPNLEAYYPFWFGADFSATNIPGRMLNSTDKLPQEYPTYGTGDMRSPALQIENAAGDSITCLCYEGHRIFSGKPQLSGLPATYGDDCETLEITLTDKLTGITAVLTYTVFPEKDVLTRSVRIENWGKTPAAFGKTFTSKVAAQLKRRKPCPQAARSGRSPKRRISARTSRGSRGARRNRSRTRIRAITTFTASATRGSISLCSTA